MTRASGSCRRFYPAVLISLRAAGALKTAATPRPKIAMLFAGKARNVAEQDIRNFLPNVFLGLMARETTELTERSEGIPSSERAIKFKKTAKNFSLASNIPSFVLKMGTVPILLRKIWYSPHFYAR